MGLSCKFSLKPIHWNLHSQSPSHWGMAGNLEQPPSKPMLGCGQESSAVEAVAFAQSLANVRNLDKTQWKIHEKLECPWSTLWKDPMDSWKFQGFPNWKHRTRFWNSAAGCLGVPVSLAWDPGPKVALKKCLISTAQVKMLLVML